MTDNDNTINDLKRRLWEAEAKAERLSEAVRNINELVRKENDPKRLIEWACENLIETLGYPYAFIALLHNEKQSVRMTASSGVDDFSEVAKQLSAGRYPDCMEKALNSNKTIVVKDPVLECDGCPLSAEYGERSGFCRQLHYDGKTYGVMTASVPASCAGDEEELSLFAEVADCLAFGLHRIELEERLHQSQYHLGEAQAAAPIGSLRFGLAPGLMNAEHESAEILRRSEEHFRMLAELAPVGIVISDKEQNTLYANPAFVEMFGYTIDEMPSVEEWWALAYPDETMRARVREEWRNVIDEALASHSQSRAIQYPVTCKDGTVKQIEFRVSCTDNLNVVVFNDITARKQAEDSLARNKAELQAIYDNAQVMLCMLDEDRRVLYANPAFTSFTGVSEDELRAGRACGVFGCVNAHDDKHGCGFGPNCAECDILAALEDTLATGVEHNNIEAHLSLDRGGECREVTLLASTALIKTDTHKNLLLCLNDITELKQAEGQLHIQSLVLNQISDRVTVTDFDGIITYVNDAVAESLGYPREKLIGSPTNVYGEDSSRGATQREILETTLRDKHWRGEVVNQTSDGREVIMDCRTHIVFDERGEKIALCGISTDITERKQTEEALRKSEQQYRSLVNNANEAIIVAQDGMLRFVNNYLLRLMEGYTQDELMSVPFSSFIYPDDRDTVVNNHLSRINGENLPQRYSFRIITHSGTVKLLEINAVLTEWDGKPASLNFLTDITERKKADEELQRRESQLQRIFEILPIGLWFADKNGTLLRGNRAGVKIWGAEPHVPISEYGVFKAWRLPSGEPIGPDDWALVKTIRNGETIIDELLEIESFDGKRKTILNYTAPVLDNNGVVDGAIVINLDISDRHALENQLRQAQKMEAVGRLAGGVAHDFNNMLSVIMGNAELALSDLDGADPHQEEIKEILKAAERSADLTGQLLAFARKQTVAPRVLDLNTTIKSMLKMLGRLIGEDIDLLWKPGKKLDPVYIDAAQIDQLFANLVVNARDAIGHNGGKVTIETDNVYFDEEYCTQHTGFIPGHYVMFAVSDDGFGMDAETRARVFEPFFTTKDQGQGTGLGLATVYGIVKQNNGFIDVYSEPGLGTTFKVYLPAHTQRATDETNNRLAKPVKPGHETILLVEDEPAILSLGRIILERLGYKAIAASTPGEAIRLAEEHNGAIDLLITDVVMPEMNGRDLAKNLLALYPNIKRLFMSGYTANVIAHQGVLDEGVNFIQKPFSMQSLSEKVREVLDKE